MSESLMDRSQFLTLVRYASRTSHQRGRNGTVGAFEYHAALHSNYPQCFGSDAPVGRASSTDRDHPLGCNHHFPDGGHSDRLSHCLSPMLALHTHNFASAYLHNCWVQCELRMHAHYEEFHLCSWKAPAISHLAEEDVTVNRNGVVEVSSRQLCWTKCDSTNCAIALSIERERCRLRR